MMNAPFPTGVQPSPTLNFKVQNFIYFEIAAEFNKRFFYSPSMIVALRFIDSENKDHQLL